MRGQPLQSPAANAPKLAAALSLLQPEPWFDALVPALAQQVKVRWTQTHLPNLERIQR